jgi:hypothetical protein
VKKYSKGWINWRGKYHETHDPEIPEEIFALARRLREMDH